MFQGQVNLKGSDSYPPVIPSPISSSSKARLIETRSTGQIAASYLAEFGYDASDDFGALETVAIYECDATGYRFFYPYHLEGKERLYRHLENTDWCYEEGKWEHDTVAAIIPTDAKVLDIGCGRGAFLAKVKATRSENVIGIELNKSAAEFARKRGITVVEALLRDHAQECGSTYDVVTAFQILEHIADPITFLQDCISVLKPGGLLIIAVPNNDGFIRFANLPLNQPPHHVGLWSCRSLAALSDVLPLKVQAIIEEPLRELDWYRQVMEQRYLKKRWQRTLYYRLRGDRIFGCFVAENAQSITGHTVIGIYLRSGDQGEVANELATVRPFFA